MAKMKKPWPGKKRPTIEMVAKQAGNCTRPSPTPPTLPTAYVRRPSSGCSGPSTSSVTGLARPPCSLRMSATHVIGCRLLPSNYGGTGGKMDRLLHALCDAARSSGYNILTFSAASDDEEIGVFHDLLSRNSVDGFVFAQHQSRRCPPRLAAGPGCPLRGLRAPRGAEHVRPIPGVDVDGASGYRPKPWPTSPNSGQYPAAFTGYPGKRRR